jgi:hypothetical protein
MPPWSVVIIGLVLGACSATEGALLVRSEPDSGAPRTEPDAGSLAPRTRAVRPDMRLHYQITGTLDTEVDAELFVSDLFDTSAREVSELHATPGRLAMAYVSVGSLENWRPDASKVPRAAVGMPLASYPNESWLDLRRAEVRALMQARFDLARDKGFDGVFASTLGAYRTTSGFELTLADELEYAIFLAQAAHERKLTIGLSGDFELSRQLALHYDWAIAFGCVARNTCSQLAPLTAAGLAVFDLESEGDQAALCSAAAVYGVTVRYKRRGSDAAWAACP